MSTIHLVSHTHWDREWYLTFQQFRLKLVHLVDRLLSILKNDPQYNSFLLDGQAIILEDYLQIRPEKEAEIKSLIEAGRLFIGPWYISPDEFLVSPESHLRNLLEGKRICQKYGKRMLVGYLPDTFGHIAQMPQILRGFGIDSACLWRGLEDQPIELLWKSPDGSSILLSYLRDSYANAANLPADDREKFIKSIQEFSQSLSQYSLTGQILLMHGADHMEPSLELTQAIQAYHAQQSGDRLVHSNLPAYFATIREQIAANRIDIPVVTGELRSPNHSPLLPNVLSTRIGLKQRNHRCESELLKWIEPFSAWANFLNRSHPETGTGHSNHNDISIRDENSLVRFAWKMLMQNHPHDSICGTSIDQVADEMRVRFDQVDQINHQLIDQNLHRIIDHIDTACSHSPSQFIEDQSILSSIIVFNPNDKPQSGLIDVNVNLDNRFKGLEIIDTQQAIVPFDQQGLGFSELISMTLDKKGLKQGLGMVDDGNVAGMVIRDFDIKTQGNKAIIQATMSDHGLVDITRWKQGLAKLEVVFTNPGINEFVVHAYSDPEVNLSFIARDVPGHGYRCYWIHGITTSGTTAVAPRKLSPIIQRVLPIMTRAAKLPILSRILVRKKHQPVNKSSRIENDYFIVEASVSQGSLTVTDKRTNQIFQGLNRFVDGADCGDLYNYCPPERDKLINARLIRFEHEASKTCDKLTVQFELKIPKSLSDDRKSRSSDKLSHIITSVITLIPGVPRLDIHTEIDNQAHDHRLRVHFPAPFSSSSAFFDGHYQLVERPIGIPHYDVTWAEQPRPEVPQRQFTLVTDGRSSLTIANRGLPEIEAFRNSSGNVELAMTLLRCIGWLSRDDITTRKGHAGPMGIATPGAQMTGKYSFDYSIIPGDDNLQGAIHQAYAFNVPLRVINSSVHPGSLPAMHSLVDNSNADFIITSIKLGEDNSSLVVRGYNMTQKKIEVKLMPYRCFSKAQLLDLAENPLEGLSVTAEGQAAIYVESNRIATIGFWD